MTDINRTAQRVTLTKKQLQEGVGAELFSLCQAIAADGELSREEILQLRSWLVDNRDADLPGIAFLNETLERIVADGRVSQAEQRELLVAIEPLAPGDRGAEHEHTAIRDVLPHGQVERLGGEIVRE